MRRLTAAAVAARLPPGWELRKAERPRGLRGNRFEFRLYEFGVEREVARGPLADVARFVDHRARQEWSVRSDRVNAHRLASKLGHVPVGCGDSYECPRCGASGRISEALLEVTDERGTMERAPVSRLLASIGTTSPVLYEVLEALGKGAGAVGPRSVGGLTFERCPWPELVGPIFSERCTG